MTWVATASLLAFLGGVVASLRGWIPQRVVTMQTLLLLIAGGVVVAMVASGQAVAWPQLLAAANIHPVTSTVAGFLLAGALNAAGAFQAAGSLLDRVALSRLGLPFASMVVVNLPTIFAMPCGRILASPMVPLAAGLGWAASREGGDPTLVAMTVFGLIVNAAASCGPSLIGGIGMLGEGMGRFPAGSFANAMQLAIMVTTVATMAVIRLVFVSTLKMRSAAPASIRRDVPEHGYFSLAVFVGLLLLIGLVRPKLPLQVVLVLGTLCVMLVARLRFSDLLGGVMLHPLSAMLAGFIVAGALSMAGGFDVLVAVLAWGAEHTPLGYVGVAILLVCVPVLIAMPCGRILSVSLIPGVLMFGQHLADRTGFERAAPVLLSSFILSGAASCGPSAIGGIGNIGEGRLRIHGNWSGRPQTLGIFLGLPVCALLVSALPLSAVALDWRYMPAALLLGISCGAVMNRLYGRGVLHVGGLLGGLVVAVCLVIL